MDREREVKDPKVTLWEPLYSHDPNGNPLVWKIWVQGDVVFRTHGRVGGKLRAPVGRRIAGTAAEPAPTRQALLYAQRAWDKKKRSAYSPAEAKPGGAPLNRSTPPEPPSGGSSGEEEVVLPMHASPYAKTPLCLEKHLALAAGAYIQPKLDGVRCVATLGADGVAVLSSRSGKRFPWFQAIREKLEPVLAALPAPFVGLDGELYCETWIRGGRELQGAERFAAIAGTANVHRKAPCPDEDRLALHVFDAIDDGTHGQATRFAVLDAVLSKEAGRLVRVPTYPVSGAAEIDEYHDRFVGQGFEGAVVRAAALLYSPRRRALQMRKYKRFDTTEFPIAGAKPGEGSESGAVVWVCRLPGGETFDCRPAAPLAERRALFGDWARYVGCPLTVQHQGVSAMGVPRFPVGLGIRHEFLS